MAAEAVTQKLYDAATMGDVATFQTLVQQDPFLVDQVSFARSRNLLHIATIAGQVGIVEELLRINSKLARDVDSKKSSSLHIAAEQGHVEIANKLFFVAPEMCWWLDDQGMNPVHIAAMRGHVGVLEVLLEHDLSPAMERLHRGQTVLHLCAKHGQVQTLKFVVEKLELLVPVKDDDGETLYNLAVRCDQVELFDLTVAKEISGVTMVVVGLIAAMAFSAVVSPPGGLWQDDTSSHRAGKAVMASSHPKLYKLFSRANTTAFVSSLLVIFLNTINAINSAEIFVVVIWYATLVAMASIGVSYGASVAITNPAETQRVGQIIAVVSAGFGGIFVFVLVLVIIMRSYSKWKTLKLQHPDLTITDRFFRGFHEGFKKGFETTTQVFE
ncbi:ankyrin repeat-containing protein At2g01680-like isoform X2 [Salvia splendens]|uniref:ankyrin repeat-containing protein At2g01680-like isoform X2 n=1 Tax=Salvia splendens TaxID=180675 RepID=UPI001C257016|nr:ankyrin repeat-containing protein At2g01680-like isoform X2 [Salvia splendens]